MSAVIEQTAKGPSLLTRFAGRFGVEPNRMLATLKSTVFKGEVSNEQMIMLLAVAERHGLDPFTREIFAFPDKGGIVPVVGVDGWSRIINTHPEFDGMEFEHGPDDANGLPAWIECIIYRKDRSHAIRAREYMAECKRGTGPWQSHPRRMLRHKSMIQCARMAFGFGGIYDQDEAERIVEMGPVQQAEPAPIADINARIKSSRQPVTDVAPRGPDPQPEPEPAAEPSLLPPEPEVTFAQVAAALNKAKSADTLDVAADLIGQVADETQRAELADLYQQRKAKIAA